MLCQTHLTYFIGTQIEMFHRMSWLLFNSLKVGCVMPQHRQKHTKKEETKSSQRGLCRFMSSNGICKSLIDSTILSAVLLLLSLVLK